MIVRVGESLSHGRQLRLVAGGGVAAAIEAPLPRHPAPSPDGKTVAFSWQGDLWLVPAEGGDPLVPAEVYAQGRRTQLPRWQGWAREVKKKLDALLEQDGVVG